MKKLFYFLLLLPAVLFSSCSKDEVSPFDLTLTMSGVTAYDGNFYTVAGDDITFDSLMAKSLNSTKTDISNVIFYIDGRPLLTNPWDIDPWTFSTAGLPAGTHTIGVTGYLLQENHSIKDFAVTYPLVIVDSEEELPADAPQIGQYSLTIRF